MKKLKIIAIVTTNNNNNVEVDRDVGFGNDGVDNDGPPAKLSFEEGWPDAERDAMSKEFDIVEPWDDPNMFFGGVHIASRDPSGTMEGAGDQRRAGVFLKA